MLRRDRVETNTQIIYGGYFWEDMEMGKFKYEIMEYDL